MNRDKLAQEVIDYEYENELRAIGTQNVYLLRIAKALERIADEINDFKHMQRKPFPS